ncbi:MAG: hypothetical protein JO327_07270 [Nitrososphaeraceae archaeon]|nr:hypothetical protein [Nitrososphaeraceae archaeon]
MKFYCLTEINNATFSGANRVVVMDMKGSDMHKLYHVPIVILSTFLVISALMTPKQSVTAISPYDSITIMDVMTLT